MSRKSTPSISIVLLLLITGCILLSGCVSLSDPESGQDFRAHFLSEIRPGQTIGQTLISRRGGLNSISLWFHMKPGSSPSDGVVTFSLYHSPQDLTPIVSIPLSIQQINASNPVKIAFPAQFDPPGQGYYLTLSTQDCMVQLMGRDEDAYTGGQIFVNGKPQDGDLSFRTSYEYGPSAAFADFMQMLHDSWLALPLIVTLLVPGWLLVNIIGLRSHLDFGERIAVSSGLSIASIPTLMLWTTTINIHWNRTAVLIASILATLVIIWVEWKRRAHFTFHIDLPSLALLTVFFGALTLRLIMVRDLAASPWVDSVHHALLIRMICEQGIFPQSYAPFLDIQTSSYHAGFHSVVAVFLWLSNLEIHTGLLLFGQVLNAITVFPVYLFTKNITRSRNAGVVAAIVTAFITPMPAYYTSWGRYTQLAGFIVLPAAMNLCQRLPSAMEASFRGQKVASYFWKYLLTTAIACAGLFLTHYRVIAFLACWLFVVALLRLIHGLRIGLALKPAWTAVLVFLLAAMAAIALTFPWWPEAVSTLFVPKLVWSQGKAAAFNDFSWGYLTSALGRQAIGFAAFGLALGLLNRRWLGLAIPLWIGLLFFIANLGALKLPGEGFVNNTSVEIILFMPISALAGYGIGCIISVLQSILPGSWRPLFNINLAAAGLIVSVIGARSLMPILNPSTFLFRQADAAAMKWIIENIPAPETIAINTFAWGYGLYAGNDGGFWISSLAGRRTIPPPVLYGFDNDPSKLADITKISSKILDYGADPQKLHAALLEYGIHYVYSGVRGGSISPRALQNSPLFKTLYAQDGAWLFKLVSQTE